MLSIAARAGSTEPYFVDAKEPPSPGPGEVLCRTLELGVCGTDREILSSGKPWMPPGEDYLILGHECLAKIEAIGAGVSEFQQGDLVTPLVRRATIDSAIRADMLTFGDYTERGIVEEHGFSSPLWLDRPEYLIPVDPDLRDIAVFTEPLSIAEKAANEAIALQQARLGDQVWSEAPRVLVTGMGPIGFAAIIAAVCRGWPVAMYGRDANDSARATLAKRLGAEYLPASTAPLAGDGSFRNGYDFILECTGAEQIMIEATEVLNARGVMAWLGADRTPRPMSLNVASAMRRGVIGNHLHLGSVNAAARDFHDALAHLRQMKSTHPQETAELITDRTSFDDALPHYTKRDKQGVKVVVEYS